MAEVRDIPDIALTQQFPGQVLSTGSAAILLLQNCSSIRSFMDVEVPRTESSLSLRSGSTQATRTLPTLGFQPVLTQHSFASEYCASQ